MRAALILALAVAGPATAQPAITDAAVRGFIAGQQAAWNASDHDRYFAGFTREARFTDQAYVGDKPPVPYGTATVKEARTQARKSKVTSQEAVEVQRVMIAPDGQSATIHARVGSRVTSDGRTRRLCASRVQTLVLAEGRLRASSQTDTYVKCRGA